VHVLLVSRLRGNDGIFVAQNLYVNMQSLTITPGSVQLTVAADLFGFVVPAKSHKR
jgi:hypothetical protein